MAISAVDRLQLWVHQLRLNIHTYLDPWMLRASRLHARKNLYISLGLFTASRSFIHLRGNLHFVVRNMSGPPTIEAQTGQTRPAPSSGPSSPVGKKARLEELPQPEPGPSNSAANPKKSHKKLARKARKKGQHIAPEPYSNEDVLWHDVESVLGKDVVDAALEAGTEYEAPFEFREEVEVEVHCLSSNGECSC